MDFSLSWIDASDASMDDLEVHITMLKSRIDSLENYLLNIGEYQGWLKYNEETSSS